MFDFIKKKYYNTKNVQNLADIIIFGNTNEIINKVFFMYFMCILEFYKLTNKL